MAGIFRSAQSWLQQRRPQQGRLQQGRLRRISAAGGLILGGAAMLAATSAVGADASASTAQTTAARTAAASAGASAEGPSGFWYGTDTNYISIPGKGPYTEPAIGGTYGGYIGMAGNWAKWQGCKGDTARWSVTDSKDARADLVTYHHGIGDGAYWFMAGPGVDPHYNGTAKEATAWGQAQAARMLSDLANLSPKITYPVVFMDVELPGRAPGYTPAADNGWNAVYTSPCSGKVKTSYIAASVDRAVFNGFASYLTSHSSYKAGVYSAPSVWASIFGTGSASKIPNTYEWTYTADTSSLSHHPYGWCLSGTSTCAQFFGGQTSSSKYAVMWQWSGGGGTYNGYGDLDQIDAARTP
jgi:hypothetical protein